MRRGAGVTVAAAALAMALMGCAGSETTGPARVSTEAARAAAAGAAVPTTEGGVTVVAPAPAPPTVAPAANSAAAVAKPAPTAPAPETVRPLRLVFDGQSLNHEPSWTGARAYPWQLLSALGDGVASSTVVAVGGSTYATRTSTAAERVDRQLAGSAPSVVLDLAGQSDLLADVAAADLAAAAEAYALARRNAGAAAIVVFTVPRSTWYSPRQEAERQRYNALLLANPNHRFDAVIDLASLPELADPSLATFLYDGMHPTENGAGVIARAAAPVVRSMLGAHEQVPARP